MAAAASNVKDDGGSFIPASQRPDGTWRKPRRVRDGYVPQDEVPLYESKGKQFAKNKPAHPVGMCPEYFQARQAARENNSGSIPGLTINPTTEAGKSKKKKKKKANSDASVSELTASMKGTQINWPEATPATSSGAKQPKEAPAPKLGAASKEQPQTTDPAKRLKNLKKRLREVEALEQRITSGELKTPDKDQQEKVKRKDDLEEQIADLEHELGL